MTKFRAPRNAAMSLAAGVLALSAAAAPTVAEHRVLITSVTINQVPQEPLSADDLPAPPPPTRKLAAPQPGQHTISKSMDMASSKLAQYAINGNSPSVRSPGKLKLK